MAAYFSSRHLIAFGIVAATTAWMLLGSDSTAEPPPPRSANTEAPRVQVRLLDSTNQPLTSELSAVTAAGRELTIKSEIRGKVIRIFKERGDLVKKGDLLLQLDARDWPERVEQAKAALAEQELAVDGAQKLSTQGLSNALELARAKTALANAKANLTNAQIQLDATRVRAPFDAILNERKIELGDLIHDGTELFDLVDTAPYLVIAQVPENQAHLVKTGQTASAELLSGQVAHGRIRYKSTQADANTRTYRIELEIANPERQPVALGASAKLRIPTGNASVYEISPTLLVISETGGLGVKTVSLNNQVQFNPVELYESDATRVWITGLEPGSRLITRGAGFVEPGDQVTPITESAAVEN